MSFPRFSSFTRLKPREFRLQSSDFQNGVFLLAIALFLGALARFWWPLQSDFPVEDGGLFFLMAQTLRENGFALPAQVFYGTSAPSLPFCYPPLAFYGAALLQSLGFSLETVFRLAPPFFSTLCIAATWKLSLTLLPQHPKRRTIAGGAALLHGLLPWSFYWMAMGGGLTRAPGLLLALLGTIEGVKLWRDGQKRAFWMTALFLGLALLTHLERARFLGLALVLVWLVYSRQKRGALQLAAIFALALALSAPWWGLCVARFGTQPFLDSWRSSGVSWGHRPSLLSTALGAEFFVPLVSLLGIAGLVWHARRLPFLIVWFGVIVLMEVRSPRHFITVPLAIAASLLFVEWSARWPKIARQMCAVLGVAWLGLQSSLLVASYRILPRPQRQAMAWAKQNSPPDARFLLPPDPNAKGIWGLDTSAEWFPALSRRAGVLTVQGTEWLPDAQFLKNQNRYEAAFKSRNWRDLERLCQQSGADFDWVWTSSRAKNQKIPNLLSDLARDARFELVFQNSDVRIYRRRK